MRYGRKYKSHHPFCFECSLTDITNRLNLAEEKNNHEILFSC